MFNNPCCCGCLVGVAGRWFLEGMIYALTAALTLLAGAIPQMNAGDRERDADEFRAPGKFQRNKSPTLKELMNRTKINSG